MSSANAGPGPALVPHTVVLPGFGGVPRRVGGGAFREIVIGTRTADADTAAR